MKIETEQYAGAIAYSSHAADPRAGGAATDSFASMLDAEVLKAEVAANRQSVMEHQGTRDSGADKSAMDFIREHGMRAYAEEVQRQKLEELREKILEAMGLTEEDLAQLPADRRGQIEQMIADQIRQQLAANAVINSEEDAGSGTTVAQALAAGPAFSTGAVLMDALEASRAAIAEKPDEATG